MRHFTKWTFWRNFLYRWDMTVEVAMVLAAGFGTRLRPMTDLCPKPLVPLGDQTVLEAVVARIATAGPARLVVNAHHRGVQVDEVARRLPLPTTVTHEPEILGTAGGVAFAREALATDGPVLVHNGDILADLDLRALIDAHADDVLATLAVRPRYDDAGRVGLDAKGFVARLRDVRFGDEVRSADFCGVQIIGATLRARLPVSGCLVGDAYIPALAAGGRLRAAPLLEHFDDIGTPSAYLAANLRWLGPRPSWRHASAEVDARVVLAQSVVGAGARVAGAGALTRCVVWPGARATAPLSDAIVTPEHVVQT